MRDLKVTLIGLLVSISLMAGVTAIVHANRYQPAKKSFQLY